MDMLHDLAKVWPVMGFLGVALWWGATISRDVKSLEVDMLGVKSDVSDLKTDMAAVKTDMASVKTDIATVKTELSALKNDVAEIKAAVLKWRPVNPSHFPEWVGLHLDGVDFLVHTPAFAFQIACHRRTEPVMGAPVRRMRRHRKIAALHLVEPLCPGFHRL